ncbi:16338_t:CDS:2 [Funneliformis caledonium]|uniref:16338_t:CDS:1 n=1 Tax=Funneliformis caledonium TaxID=1117310 RepID=A0A9N9BUT8_9GLOM|nr:16338_t:CDS:2 [Funneliformis caledonium]
MNAPGQQLKLPIPRLSNTSLHSTNWPTNSQLSTNLNPVICQPMLTPSIGKPMPNKRGRKPLSKMPETKKHIQNLTNQRAFRRRKEDYVRTLETKATTYEILYTEAQSHIKSLRERLALLQRRLDKTQESNKCDASIFSQSIEETQQMCESNSYRSNERQSNEEIPIDVEMSDGTYGGNQDESIEDIIRDPLFCDTKEGDLCFCEPVSIEDLTKDPSQLSSSNDSFGSYYLDHKARKRLWIIPSGAVSQCATPTTPSQTIFSNFTTCNDSQPSRENCPTISSPERSDSQWQLQENDEQCNFSSPPLSPSTTPSTSNFTQPQHHPLNLKWILGDNNNDENGDDSE